MVGDSIAPDSCVTFRKCGPGTRGTWGADGVCLRVQNTGLKGRPDVMESSSESWSCEIMCTVGSKDYSTMWVASPRIGGRIRKTYKQGKNLNDPHTLHRRLLGVRAPARAASLDAVPRYLPTPTNGHVWRRGSHARVMQSKTGQFGQIGSPKVRDCFIS